MVRTPCNKKGKVHLCTGTSLCTGRTAQRGSRVIALLFLGHGSRRGWGVSVTPRPLFAPGKTRYSLYMRLGGLQGRSGQVRKISPPPEFDPLTVQPVGSRCTVTWTRCSLICYNKLQKHLSSHFSFCYNRIICYHEQHAQKPSFVPSHMSGHSFFFTHVQPLPRFWPITMLKN